MAEIRALNEDMQSDLREYEADGLALLQLSPEAKPLGIVTRINEHARYLRAEGATLDQDDVLALGILLGWQYVRAHGWHWGQVFWDPDTSAIGVLNRNNAWFINPMWWMNDVLSAARAPNFLLNFNMVAGNLPPGQANEAMGFH
jgi:hypothetical protein